ncbi:hypothetical protein [Vibrio vulnificus]|uniref:hypothetical protein n=1 Tax=Vibrio vulnificus TaxID=672 RepID=UPI0005F19ADB|nr:hypothetical protein [Vibrio vulnificus]
MSEPTVQDLVQSVDAQTKVGAELLEKYTQALFDLENNVDESNKIIEVASQHAESASLSAQLSQQAQLKAEELTHLETWKEYRDSSAKSAVIASDAAENAHQSLNQSQLVFNEFDSRSLGSKNEEPTVNNQGEPLRIGTTYWHDYGNDVGEQKIWNGQSWISPQKITTNNTEISNQYAQVATAKAEMAIIAAEKTAQDAVATREERHLAEQAAQTATQKAEQTEQDALATSQDRKAVSDAELSVDENAKLVSEKSILVEQLTSQTAQNAQIATEQAKRAENLVESATGGALLKEANLSDLYSPTAARANLSVYSQQQVDTRLEKKVNALALELNSTTYVYVNNRLTQQTIQHGDGEEIVSYTYTDNALTQAVSIRNGVTKTTTYVYDSGRLVSIGVATE